MHAIQWKRKHPLTEKFWSINGNENGKITKNWNETETEKNSEKRNWKIFRNLNHTELTLQTAL